MTQPVHLRHVDLHLPRIPGLATRAVPIGLGAGLVVGAIAWQHQISRGMVTTGMRDVVPWGAYTIAYLAFIAVSAGALAMACTGLLVRSSRTRHLVRGGLGTALGGLTTAFIAFMVNLDRPARVYNLLFHPNWSSPVIWSIYSVLAGLLISALLLILLRGRPGEASVAVRAVAVAGLVAAPVTAGAAAAIFALQKGRPAWNGGLTLPLFLTSAIVAGTAAVTLLPREPGTESSGTRGWLATVLSSALAIGLLLTAIGYLTAVRSSPDQWTALQRVLPGGQWSWLFWIQWIVGGLLPLVLLIAPAARRRAHSLDAAAALALCGVITAYVALVPGGLSSPRVFLPPGMALGTGRVDATSFQALGFYHPTLTEYGILVGLLCVFLAVVVPVVRRHPRSDPAGR